MTNPFEEIQTELKEIKAVLKKQVDLLSRPKEYSDVYIPVSTIVEKYISHTTFYKQVKEGNIKIYKLGRRTFVKADEFYNSAFIQVDS